MLFFLQIGDLLIESFMDVKDFLGSKVEFPILGETSVVAVLLGGGLSVLLVYKVIKFFTGL